MGPFQFTTVGGVVMRYSTTSSAAHGHEHSSCLHPPAPHCVLVVSTPLFYIVTAGRVQTWNCSVVSVRPLVSPLVLQSLQLDVRSLCPLHRHFGFLGAAAVGISPSSLRENVHTLHFCCESLPVKNKKNKQTNI